MSLREAAQQVLTMLKTGMPEYNIDDVLEVLEAALAEPVQEFASIPGTNVRVRLPMLGQQSATTGG